MKRFFTNMSDIIHLLPDSVANQIAAGEVIQRPASIIKELVENAIDAGATFIQVLIKDAGRTLVQVVDNGKGMSETDARMAFERHATSKISDAADLFSLRTMGFRGEALASIAAVAQVELRTRRQDDELGVMVEIAGTRVFKQEMIQCAVGTTFLVKNLFFNVPARRRFLKSDSVEKSHILNEFYRIVLVNSNISFTLNDGDEEMFNLPPSNVKFRIENLFGKISKKKWQQQLLTIETETSLVKITGYVGKPEFAQKSATQYFFVNGRYMRHPYFHKAVIMAYNQMIQASESPNYFIYFEVDPQTIDINIHPTKTEIKFENEQAIWSILSAAIKESLGKFNIVPSIDFDQEGAIELPVNRSFENIRPPQTTYNPAFNPFTSSSNGSSSGYKRPPISNWENLYTDFEKAEKPEESLPINWEESEPTIQNLSIDSETHQQINLRDEIQKDNFQLKNKYILTTIKSGLLIIDQRRAHIRILFDQFIAQQSDFKAQTQQVLFPEVLELLPHDVLVFDQMENELVKHGFVFEKQGTNAFVINGVPAQLGTDSVLGMLGELIEKAKSSLSDFTSNIHDAISLSFSTASAVKSGQKLSTEEMTDIINRLFASENHNFTPDGKKIMSILSQDEIEKLF